MGAALGQPKMLVDGERRPHAAALRHIADAETGDGVGRQADDLRAGQLDAAGRRHQPGDGVAQRRLAHAVAADDGQDAAVQGDGDVLHGVGASVVDVEPIDPQDRARSDLDASPREPAHCRPPPM